MRAIIIDAENRQIRETELDEKDTLDGLQKAVGGYITLAGEVDGNDLYVNDEGLFTIGHGSPFFDIGLHQPFAGNGIIAGHDDEGETTPATVSLDAIKRRVKFGRLAGPPINGIVWFMPPGKARGLGPDTVGDEFQRQFGDPLTDAARKRRDDKEEE